MHFKRKSKFSMRQAKVRHRMNRWMGSDEEACFTAPNGVRARSLVIESPHLVQNEWETSPDRNPASPSRS